MHLHVRKRDYFKHNSQGEYIMTVAEMVNSILRNGQM